ncbi:S-layer homology domain-containing protein, partial [Cohnella sp. WQ 127256]|uniref:S-layer homology domain-containing protein n=1 Tax=Cohnella sp. WQ 127256 TaxID=2938790 RepID=UPI002118FF3B
ASNATGYQWQVDQGAGFANISNGAPYSGATTSTLTITGATAGMNGYLYRVVATGLAAPAATSNSAALTVNPPPSITSHPSASTIAAGANTTFSVTASNATGYQWQVDTGTGFTNISNVAPYSGATTATLTITGATAGMNGYLYRVVATGLATPAATSNIASLTVNPIPGAPIITSTVAGDSRVSLAWNPVPDATGYKVYQSVASGTYGVEVASVGQSVYGTDINGLTNGTTYYFVVQAINGSLAGPYSNQVSAMPQVPSPGQPVLQPAIAGNSQVKLTWDPVPGSTGYKVYLSETSGTYGVSSATVSGSVYSFDVTGLTNGTTYYFAVKAVNPGGDSAASNEVSAMPVTVPAAPTIVSAVAGDGKATITFTAPTDNGGSTITGYEVTASPGNVVMTGTASPITFTGLSNGISYTFTVKAINSAGSGTSSVVSNVAIPSASSSSGGSGSPTPLTPEAADRDVLVLVNGKGENVGTATTTKVNDRTVTTVTIDQKKLEAQLAAEGSNTRVTIRVNSKPDVMIVELNGQMVKDMESKQAIIEIKTNHATYALPAEQIDMDSIFDKVGNPSALKDIKIWIEIAALTTDSMRVVENAAAKGTFTLVAPPLSFTIKAEYAGSIVDVSRFNTYVERIIALPDGVDRNKVTTGIAIEADGSVRHVPTKVIANENKYYAVINSLTNSTYAVVWNPLEFQDVSNHWAQKAVNNMGSRMVIDGTGEGKFNPDRDITRAEFAAIIVRGLGLKLENDTSAFKDVKAADWYSSAINTAYAHHLISGYEDGTFRPNDKITREQAMAIIAKAMEITGLKQNLAANSIEDRLRSFTDAADASEWAKSGIADSVEAGIITGKSKSVLDPKALITRAEVAAIIERLLQKSDLI